MHPLEELPPYPSRQWHQNDRSHLHRRVTSIVHLLGQECCFTPANPACQSSQRRISLAMSFQSVRTRPLVISYPFCPLLKLSAREATATAPQKVHVLSGLSWCTCTLFSSLCLVRYRSVHVHSTLLDDPPHLRVCVCVSAGVCACILCVYVSTVCVWCAAFGGRKLSPPVVTDHVLATECCTQCLYA